MAEPPEGLGQSKNYLMKSPLQTATLPVSIMFCPPIVAPTKLSPHPQDRCKLDVYYRVQASAGFADGLALALGDGKVYSIAVNCSGTVGAHFQH